MSSFNSLTSIPAVTVLLAVALSGCGGEGRPQSATPAPKEGPVTPAQILPAGARNRLALEKSPYLKQHQDNPVDWYPWGDEAFRKAIAEDKPIFLSIGYSTCHWCHVMERESFMNEAIASYLNERFVCIKVDREERPDVDQVYMSAAQAMTGRGGWPLSVWLDHNRKPFFAGTYFPPEDRPGRPGFGSLLARIADAWRDERATIQATAEELVQKIGASDAASPGEPTQDLLDSGFEAFRQSYDQRYAGFGSGTKFPRPVVFEFLLRYLRRAGKPEAREMTVKTLRAMREGGMYDHLGGGFHRYSTDPRWRVPHFEKMLYDQALLARAYVQAWQVTGCDEFADTARETLDYVLRDLASPDGGFWSAEDADSDLPGGGHAEGAFYVWTPEQVRAALKGPDADLFCRAFAVTDRGNFESFEPGEPRGTSILREELSPDDLAAEFSLPVGRVRDSLERSRSALFEARRSRPRPHLDDKILTDWNGLMIGALASAGRALGEPRYLAAAEKAAGFLMKRLRRPDGHWFHQHVGDSASVDAFLDDYAFLAEGFLLLHQATQKTEYLRVAVSAAAAMIEDFGDPQGGFFNTSSSGERLIARLKESYDGALPSGNAVAALTLFRLADLCSRSDFRAKAEGTLRAFAGTVATFESGYPYYLCALDASLGPPREVVIAGDPSGTEVRGMLAAVGRRYDPDLAVALVPSAGPDPGMIQLIPMTESRAAGTSPGMAWLCENYACREPVSTAEELRRQLADSGR
ncbi:MAG: thioredoxin domain-containing protein [Planctomycetes bacterium]|nr:thioredoxin domain-containing protein [Planctomycetota bacterium]